MCQRWYYTGEVCVPGTFPSLPSTLAIKSTESFPLMENKHSVLHGIYFVYTHHESTSSWEITAQHVGFLIFHSEINLHSTYNALFVVEISRRGSNDPGSSVGVVIFLSSEVFQTFSRSMCVSTATECLFFVERLPSLLLGVGRQALHPQVPWLHQRQSRVLWMERDCTLTLSLTASMSTSASSPCSSEEEGLHLTPLPRIAGRYFGGGGTGTPPHNIGLFVFSPAVDGELTYGGVNTVHHTEVHTNCSLKGLKHLDTMKLSANPLVDAVDDVVNLMAVYSLIMRSAAILFEHFFFGTWSPGVPCCFRLES